MLPCPKSPPLIPSPNPWLFSPSLTSPPLPSSLTTNYAADLDVSIDGLELADTKQWKIWGPGAEQHCLALQMCLLMNAQSTDKATSLPRYEWLDPDGKTHKDLLLQSCSGLIESLSCSLARLRDLLKLLADIQKSYHVRSMLSPHPALLTPLLIIFLGASSAFS